MLEVSFGTRWLPAGDLVLDWCIVGGALHLMLDRALLAEQRRVVSVTTARWRVNGTEYRTATTVEGGGAFRVVARREVHG